jgi:hypothetical protein
MVIIKDLGMRYPYTGGKSKRMYRYALFECPFCGCSFEAQKSTRQKSCNDCVKDVRKRKHGMCFTPIYYVWGDMKSRCNNKSHSGYENYGGRGITVCDEWRNDFLTFNKWAINNGYKDGLEIDRINNNGNYEPSNCKFSTRSQNSQNTRLIHINNTSGYRCVFWHKVHKNWIVVINNNGKRYYRGHFLTKEEAALHYNSWVIEHKTNHPLNVVLE